jgi:hypothetical protein
MTQPAEIVAKPKNKTTWNIPVKIWDARRQGAPNPPNPHGDAEEVRWVRWGVPEPPLSPSGPVPEEDLLGPGPTRSDRALANARREGSLVSEPPSGQSTGPRRLTAGACRARQEGGVGHPA